jgi:hypothetical protein
MKPWHERDEVKDCEYRIKNNSFMCCSKEVIIKPCTKQNCPNLKIKDKRND